MERIDFEKQKRVDYIDIYRSFGIIFMIMGHIDYGEKFDFFIHAFHIPMFFWISGFFFKHKLKVELSFRQFVIKKQKTLLIPYCVFGAGHYFYWLTYNDFSIKPLLHVFSINTRGLPICGALWFLTSLFFTDITFFLIDRYIENNILKTIIVCVISFCGNIIGIIVPFTLPFALSTSFVGVGLYYLGYLTKLHEENKVVHKLMNLSWLSNSILAIITSCLIFSNGYINMRLDMYSVIPLFWINVLLSVIVGMNFSRLIYRVIKNNLISRWLIEIGKNGITYVCLKQIVILL